MNKLHSPEILFEDNHLIAVYKKPGQTVQPEPGKPQSLDDEVKAFIKIRDEKPGDVFLGVIHRLDMPVGGIVLFAKTSKALVRMNQIFQKREVKKYYQAVVEHHPPYDQDMITHWLRRDDKKKFSKAFSSEVTNAEKAQLKYQVIAEDKGKIILRIELMTGRKHQIRAQLSAIGCPIVGDVKYGASKPSNDGSISLTAVELSFIHPVKNEPVVITAKPHK